MQHWMVLKALMLSLLCILLSANSILAYPLIPDPDMTEGQLCTEEDPDFSKYRYQEQIPYCRRHVSKDRRDYIYDNYGIAVECRYRFTIDHFIPLSIGGDNSDTNLWPEHVLVKATRPNLETNLYMAMSEGRLTQKEAIDIIVSAKTDTTQALVNASIKGGCDRPSGF